MRRKVSCRVRRLVLGALSGVVATTISASKPERTDSPLQLETRAPRCERRHCHCASLAFEAYWFWEYHDEPRAHLVVV